MRNSQFKLYSFNFKYFLINSNISTDNKHSRTSLEQAASDVEKLRYQVKHLKSTNDNAMYDNRRLTDELAEVQCHKRELETKQIDAEKEIDRMKRQLQQYVQEVQRAEELLQRKEEERNDMLDQFKILSHDAVTLEGTNQSLELEAAETKYTQWFELKVFVRVCSRWHVHEPYAELNSNFESLSTNLVSSMIFIF